MEFTSDDLIADLNSLTYLDCVIKETMRLFPTVPLYGRHLDGDIEFDDGVVLPKGERHGQADHVKK
jgi:cytochrome P450